MEVTRQLEVRSITVNYGSVTAAQDVSLQLDQGEIACLLGPSGCGKTTVLRAIAGFEQVTRGDITLHGKLIAGNGVNIPPDQRRVGMVFQDFALFPHLNIRRNVAFGLRQLSPEVRRARVAEMLQLVGLSDQADKFPHELSGGQQQRVALARALAPEPEILLLDEPFSSLDAELREQLACEVRQLLKANDVTAILVTHDQHEAFAMADRISLLRNGAVVQDDTPYQLYHHPKNEFVAGFIGDGAIIHVKAGEHEQLERDLGLTLGDTGNAGPLKLLVRPEDVRYAPDSELRLEITGRVYRGADYLYQLALPDGQRVSCLAPSRLDVKPGDTLPVHFDQRHVVVFPG